MKRLFDLVRELKISSGGSVFWSDEDCGCFHAGCCLVVVAMVWNLLACLVTGLKVDASCLRSPQYRKIIKQAEYVFDVVTMTLSHSS